VTAMLKGFSGNHMALKAGDAQSGTLAVKLDGGRPPGYSAEKLEGAIILGTGGDGTFFEGCTTQGVPSDAADNAVQANIVAAGYGSSTTAVPTATTTAVPACSLKGDVNGNGTIDIVDALLIAQAYVELNPSNYNTACADVNCSGAVDVADALLIAQRYVGLISSFPC
jgi:hypothetical protein